MPYTYLLQTGSYSLSACIIIIIIIIIIIKDICIAQDR